MKLQFFFLFLIFTFSIFSTAGLAASSVSILPNHMQIIKQNDTMSFNYVVSLTNQNANDSTYTLGFKTSDSIPFVFRDGNIFVLPSAQTVTRTISILPPANYEGSINITLFTVSSLENITYVKNATLEILSPPKTFNIPSFLNSNDTCSQLLLGVYQTQYESQKQVDACRAELKQTIAVDQAKLEGANKDILQFQQDKAKLQDTINNLEQRASGLMVEIANAGGTQIALAVLIIFFVGIIAVLLFKKARLSPKPAFVS